MSETFGLAKLYSQIYNNILKDEPPVDNSKHWIKVNKMSDKYTSQQIADFLEKRIEDMENNTEVEKVNYQVIGVYGTQLTTFLSFWAEDDAKAAKLAGKLKTGTILCRVVEDVER